MHACPTLPVQESDYGWTDGKVREAGWAQRVGQRLQPHEVGASLRQLPSTSTALSSLTHPYVASGPQTFHCVCPKPKKKVRGPAAVAGMRRAAGNALQRVAPGCRTNWVEPATSPLRLRPCFPPSGGGHPHCQGAHRQEGEPACTILSRLGVRLRLLPCRRLG